LLQEKEDKEGSKISFFSKSNFANAASSVTNLRRRLSSENVSSPYDDRLDKVDPEGTAIPGPGRNRTTSGGNRSGLSSPYDSNTNVVGAIPSPAQPGTKTTSAPTSPLKERPEGKKGSFLGKVTSLSQVVSAKANEAKDKAEAFKAQRAQRHDRCFTLLVIDDQNTDWSKYFRGKKIHTDWDLRVEQAEFKELTVIANSEAGVTVCLPAARGGKLNAFKPDFLLVRQNLKDAGEDNRNLLLGFRYGGIPSINSLESIYNFQDKPWVYSHLLQIQQKLGKEAFPLIDQTFYPNHKEMVKLYSNNGFIDKIRAQDKFPCVFKIGHAHGGLGKVRVDSQASFQDLASVVAVSTHYCTVEEFIDAKYDLHIFKIDKHYKALMRKSLSGNWKTNVGQSILEEVPVQDKYKLWIDQVSEIFGGLAICSLEAVVAKDGREVIIEVNDCALGLMGESQEEDRRLIADLVLQQMENRCGLMPQELMAQCRPPGAPPLKPNPSSTVTGSESGSRPGSAMSSVPSEGGGARSKEPAAKAKGKPETGTLRKEPKKEEPKREPPKKEEPRKRDVSPEEKISRRKRHDSDEDTTDVDSNVDVGTDDSEEDSDESSADSEVSSASSTVKRVVDVEKTAGGEKDKNGAQEGDVEGEDTMANLTTTFAGIFGKANLK